MLKKYAVNLKKGDAVRINGTKMEIVELRFDGTKRQIFIKGMALTDQGIAEKYGFKNHETVNYYDNITLVRS